MNLKRKEGKMKVRELEERAIKELQVEREKLTVETIKERLKEIDAARGTLDRMIKGYKALLEEDVDDLET